MPSVDDLLRQAFEPRDDEWVRRAPAAHARVVARHRRDQLVRRGTAVAAVAATVVAAVAIAVTGPRPRATEPAAPSPTTSTSPGVPRGDATPLEGTWTSGRLGVADVRAAARAAGAPEVADLMLEQLPVVPFRVTVDVRGARLTTMPTDPGADNPILDKESLSVSGKRLEVRPFGSVDVRTVHIWVLDGNRLTLSFVSSTEPVTDGVPGEAWQRLLYDSAVFTR